MSNQVTLKAESRADRGKGAAGRLRRQGRVPGIMYGYEVEPTAVHVDALELYHVLHTEAGVNVLIRLEVAGETFLTVARDMQRHPVRGETLHVDFLAVDRNAQIAVEVPIALTGEEDAAPDGGVVNQVLYTAPVLVKPLDVPNQLELSVAGMAIGDVKRLEDLADQLPAGAEFDGDPESTVVTINAPVTEADLEAMEAAAGVEQDAPEVIEQDEPAAPAVAEADDLED